jgi:hypothetical protein
MTIRLKNLERLSLAEMKEFVTTNRHVGWSAVIREAVHGLVERVLKAQQYRRLSKGQKGFVRSFLAKVTAVSRAQMTRLIQRWVETRRIERKPAQRPSFPRRYVAADIALLAEIDAAHGDLSGPAVRHLCRRGGDGIWRRAVPATGGHLGVAHLQSAQIGDLPEDSRKLAAHAGAPGLDRGAPPARPERTGRLLVMFSVVSL